MWANRAEVGFCRRHPRPWQTCLKRFRPLGWRMNSLPGRQGPRGPAPTNLSCLGPSSPYGPYTLDFLVLSEQATTLEQP